LTIPSWRSLPVVGIVALVRPRSSPQFAIDMTTPEGQQTGLRLNSVIQCENLLTYDQALILRVLGRLSATAMEQIDACLKAALGIP